VWITLAWIVSTSCEVARAVFARHVRIRASSYVVGTSAIRCSIGVASTKIWTVV
jgi:hypothetical protein